VPGNDDLYDADDGEVRTAIVKLSDIQGRGSPRDRHLLVQLEGEHIGMVVTLHGELLRIGRHQDSELLLRDGGVSRNHARFLWEADGYVLEDLDSANGTYVQGERVTRHPMRDGDIVQFGPSAVFKYSLADAEQEAMLIQLYDASVTDALTGAYNREHFDTRLASELSFARRHQADLSMLLLDLDHFKNVNDTYGHPAGDSVLRELAKNLSMDLRLEDVFARYGGEEFAIILRGTSLAEAAQAAERCRSKVADLVINHEALVIRITVSIGVASIGCCKEATSEEFISVADRRLYAAKHAGRNQVVAAG
jgi:two-component system, cell cycle response regulator